MTSVRLLAWLPWILAAAAVLVFAISPGGVVLAAAWGLVILAVRVVATLAGSRQARTTIWALFIGACFLAAFEGGWYVIPAGIAFLLADRRSEAAPGTPALRGPQLEVIAGVLAAFVGWLALAFVAWAPLYSSQSSVTTSGLPVESGTSALSLAAAGMSGRTVIVLAGAAILLAIVAVGAIAHGRFGRRWGHWAGGLATIGLAVVAFLGAFSIGPWLVPALALAALSWWSGRGDPRPLDVEKTG